PVSAMREISSGPQRRVACDGLSLPVTVESVHACSPKSESHVCHVDTSTPSLHLRNSSAIVTNDDGAPLSSSNRAVTRRSNRPDRTGRHFTRQSFAAAAPSTDGGVPW